MNLLDLMIKVAVDDKASDGIAGIAKKASTMADGLSKLLPKVAKVGTVAAGAASTALGFLTKNSASNFAEYEQLVGGAKLMFGDAYDFIAEKAAGAYATVQMSQNEYLQQANSFATGLKTALGGNEQAAAELADRILRAEADIVAATGAAQESVQNAFNGIMKSNFTMLDNLQIGITPTKEGFQELIGKVNQWNEANGKATAYQMGNLADMQNALVDYIDMVGMSNYAQNEALATISGSMAAAKSAWQNFLTGLADENADMSALTENLVGSVAVAADNLLPRVEIALGGVSDMITALAPTVLQAVPQILGSVLPGLAEGVVAIANSFFDQFNTSTWNMIGSTATQIALALGEGFVKGIGEISGLISEAADTIFVYFLENSDRFTSVGVELLAALATGFATGAGSLAEVAAAIVLGIVNNLSDNLPAISAVGGQIVGKLTESIGTAASMLAEAAPIILDMIVSGITTALPALVSSGLDIIETILSGLISALPNVTAAAVDVVAALVSSLLSMTPMIIETGVQLLTALVDNLPAIIAVLVTAAPPIIENIISALVLLLPQIVDAGVQLLTALIDNLPEIIEIIITAAPAIIGAVIDALLLLLPEIVQAGVDLFVALIEKLPEAITTIVRAVPQIITSIVSAITGRAGDIVEAGRNLISGLYDGIVAGWDAIKNGVKNVFSAVTDTVKSVFDEHSPSRVFAEIGENLMEGLWVGVERRAGDVMSRIDGVMSIPTKTISFEESAIGKSSAASINSTFAALTPLTGSGQSGDKNINLVVDGRVLASVVYNPLSGLIRQKGESMA